MAELALTQERGDDLHGRFRVVRVTLGLENHPVGWVLVDATKSDSGLAGCLLTTSKENAHRLCAAAVKRGGLVPLLHSVVRCKSARDNRETAEASAGVLDVGAETSEPVGVASAA